MDAEAFITSLVTSLVIFLLLALIYILFSRRPGNYPVYYPAVLIREEGEGAKGNFEVARLRTPLQWLREAWNASEAEIVGFAGLDAAAYIQFLDSALKILGMTALFCIPVLITLAALDDNYETQAATSRAAGNSSSADNSTTFSALDKLAMGNISERSPKIWAFSIGAYWLSVVTYGVLWSKYRHMCKLRKGEQSARARAEQFAVLVRGIPPSHSRAADVDAFFRRIHPESYEKCILVPGGAALGAASNAWEAVEGTKAKLRRAEALLELQGKRPQHKTGKFGLCGPTVDSIDWYKQQLEQQHKSRSAATAAALGEEEKRHGAAILVFNTSSAASAAGQSLYSASSAGRWVTSGAPEPRQVLWANVGIPWYGCFARRALVYTLVALMVLFYMIPIAFVSALSTLDRLQKLAPFVRHVNKIPVLATVLQAFLPQLALIIFMALLPSLLLFLSRLEGIVSQSHLERAAAGKYFYFIVFNVFLGVTLGSSLFASLKPILKDPSSIVSLLGKAIPPAASFFITFIALKFFVGYGLQLSRLVPLIVFHLKRRYLCKTQEDIKAAWAPKDFGYATRVPTDTLTLTIALCYAVIAPLVLPFALVYFAVAWIIARHEALKVVVPAYESHGRMWPHIHTRCVAALLVSQLAMLGYFALKKFVYTVVLVPLPVATLLFAFITNKLYYPTFKSTPLEVTLVDQVPTVSMIVNAYTPRCLLPEEEHDRDKFEDARSAVSSSGITSPA